MKLPTLGPRGQRSKSCEAKDKFGRLAVASFATPLDRVVFVVAS